MALNKKERPLPQAAAPQDVLCWLANDTAESKLEHAELQTIFLTRRYRVRPSIVGVIAGLAFDNRRRA